jgi:hypothetical protein
MARDGGISRQVRYSITLTPDKFDDYSRVRIAERPLVDRLLQAMPAPVLGCNTPSIAGRRQRKDR